MCAQPAQKRDEFITEQLTNHLFQTSNLQWGMDLAALNIQRGRDHGLAPYNSWREACGLQPFTSWVQMLKVMSPETQRKFKKIYRDIEDIDLFPGAMAEKPVNGGLVGPTFACILAQQFSNLRKGDSFWYENGGFESSFTPAQLQQLRKITLARILCDNLDSIDTIQPFVFLTADNDRNKYMPCEKVPNFDLAPWTEHRIVNDFEHQYEDHHSHETHYSEVTTSTYPPYHNHHAHDKPITGHHPHHNNYDKHTTPYPFHGHSTSIHHYSPEQSSSSDHYHKPSYNDYQKPILLPPEENYNSHYGGINTPQTSYKPKPQNNYSFTYEYEFDLEHKPAPAPTPAYLKPKPSINPTATYTVIHVHHTLDHQTPSTHSDSYHPSSHYTKPHYHSTHTKPHHDTYLPDHTHGQKGDSYLPTSDSYFPSKPHHTYRPVKSTTEQPVNEPFYPNEERPPSVDNYGPDLTFVHDSYQPTIDSYKPIKPDYGPMRPVTDSYKPPDQVVNSYKPPSDSYGPPPPSSNTYRPSKPSTFGHTHVSNYRPHNAPTEHYGLPKPTINKYGQPKPPSHNYGFTDPPPTEVNYPTPEIIYSNPKPGYQHFSSNIHHKPIRPLKGSPSYTVIEVPSDHSKPDDCAEAIHSKPSHIVTSHYDSHSHHSYPTSHGHHGHHGHHGDLGESHSKPVTHHSLSSLKSKPSNAYNEERPIIIFTSASSTQIEYNKLKNNQGVRKPSHSTGITSPDKLPQFKPSNIKFTHSSNANHQEDFTKYTTLETSPELPTPGLGAKVRNAAQLNREMWIFDTKEVTYGDEIPDVPYLPSDPESVRELPHPIEEADEEEFFEEEDEHEEHNSRSL